ncbi:hypothetical protein GHT06_012788 [Daphnia sinensis]|uniref:Bromo domain-containing protein n=1 Tax=Daphnia sinensis TaxID=1820382 RepID=A0AAD5PWG5_9CRUS|nr:hypothetical protein GHT06_012788 [Daphnia sinensis]
MDQGPVGAVEECFSVGAEEMVVHSEEVVTSNDVVASAATNAATIQQLPQAQTQPSTIYNIPTVLTPSGPIMQVVTLQTVQQPSTAQAGLTNALRNIRLIAIQPKLPPNGTNGRAQPISLQPSPIKPQVKIQPQQNEPNKKVAVKSFYSKKLSQPAVLAPKPPQQVVKPSPSFYKEQQREREMKEFSHLSEELQRGLRIFLDLTISLHNNTTWPFMEEVDPVKDGAPDYHQVIKKPMWLKLIKDKFRKNQYSSISEFVGDMRLILENCYRYNGPNHPITKKALRLEQSLEQKLALLPSDLRSLCAVAETDAERKARPGSSDAYFSVLLHRVRHEREQRDQLAKEKRAEEQRLKREEKERQRCLWAERMMNPEVKAQMKTMWEIPQIGHFLHLARGALHIGEIAQYELEHMFLMPEASALLATLMTSLLSSPNQRVKLAESPPTPYAVWSAKVNSRVAEWYRNYNKEGRQFVKLHELLGLEPMFWRVCGDTNPLDGGKLYHQLSFLKRVWIFKGICDTVAHSHKTVQEAMAEEEGPESRQVTLGQDANGFTYLHFPAVSGSDIRVYRQKTGEFEADPIWGPIITERREAEEERIREEELKAAELKKRKRTSAASKRASTTPKRSSPAKKKQSRTPIVNTTPTPQRKKSSTADERPSRIGTRVSPRTLQRQTGLTLYKDTSSESEDDEDSVEVSEISEEPNGDKEEEEEEDEEPIEQTVVVAKTAQRKKRGRRTRSRKRPVKKKLQKIVEEAEETVEKETAIEEREKVEMKVEKEEVEEKVKNEEKIVKEEEKEGETPEIGKDDNVDKAEETPNKVENSSKEEDEEVKQPLLLQDEIIKTEIKKEEIEQPIINEEKNEPKKEGPVKCEGEESSPSATTQRFTVSQLLQKLAPSKEPETPAAPETTTSLEAESMSETVSDPDRASYDPYFFELIISNVEELQDWINRFSDVNEEGKPRPRCEVKLREHLQSLLEEAQPLAADQQQANQKICQQLWKEWERYRCSSSNNRQSSGATEDSDRIRDLGMSDSEGSQAEDNASSIESEDGVRHSRRLRVKRILNTANGSHQSTRSSSPMEEEPPSKQNRKGSYNFDPAWDSDAHSTPETPVGRKRSNYIPEMKNPGFWIGRRVTRATAEFVGVPEESTTPPQEPQNSQPVIKSVDKSPPAGVQTDQLVDQLRQLRRQQVLLSSNDPRPSASAVSSPNGSPSVYFPSKDGQLIRITNPKTAGFLTQLKANRPLQPNPSSPIAAQPRKIFIHQRPPLHLQKAGGSPPAPVSIDITQLVSQAALNGLIVAHEPRSLSLDMGQHGRFMVTAQMTPAGPKVISASPLPRKLKIVTNAASTDAASVVQPVPELAVAVPESTAVDTSSPEVVPAVPTSTELNSAIPVAEESIPTTSIAANLAHADPPAAIDVTNVTKSIPPTVTPSLVNPAITPKTNGSPAVSRQILISDPRQNNIISPDILRSVAGPEAVGARLTIVKEGNSKMLTLILSNGEIRRLTNSQVQQIQAAVRNKTKPTSDEAAAS